MSSRTLKFLKEWGLFGNFLSALIIWAIGLLLTFLNKVAAFNYVISFSIPLFVIVGIAVALGGAIYLIYKFISNPVRQYITIFGYYRKLYHSEYYPYVVDGERYYTKIKKTIEYRIARNGITTISPITFYAYKPRGSKGEEVLSNIIVSASLNGQPNMLNSEQSMVGTDGYSIALWSTKPLQSGDLISFCVEYRQYGLHAATQEELDLYKNLPDLANTVRNRLVKEKNVEYVYASPSYSLKYVVEVIFPQDYPRKLLESVDDMAIISLSSKPLDKATMRKIANISVEDNRITLEYKHEFRSAHGHYVLWRLPRRDELNKYAISNGLTNGTASTIGMQR